MSPLDVIPLPGYPGMFGRRRLAEAWQKAGSPHPNSAGRLYGEQKRLFDGFRDGLPGFAPADNPDDESQRLAHVRFVALDIDPTPERIKRLSAAGLYRPYAYEPWHWELPNVRDYAIVRSLPGSAAGGAGTEDDMSAEAEQMIRELHQQLLPGKAGVKSAGDVYKIIAATGSTTSDAKTAAVEARDLAKSLVTDFQAGQSGVRTAGRLLSLLSRTRAEVEAANAAIEALALSNGADPSAILKAVQDGVKNAMDGLTLTIDAG